MQLWTEKYKPKTVKDIIGQDHAIKAVKRFVTNYGKSKKKALFLLGPPGVGKTCIPHAVASSLNLELLEVNASDFRDKDCMNSLVGSAIFQRPLFSSGKIILVDDIDGLSPHDRGGLQAITKLIEKTPYPFILTASDISDYRFNQVKRISDIIELEKITTDDIANHLSTICKKECVKCQLEALKKIARRSGNDIRGSINDLQSLFVQGREITKEDVELLSEREHTETITNALTRIFKTTDLEVALGSFDYVSGDPRAYFLWIDENLPKEYEKVEDIAKAYEKISKADIYNSRILNRQYWRFLVYMNSLLSGGIALAKESKYRKIASFSPPGRPLKIFWANQKALKKRSIAEKMPPHRSIRGIMREDIHYLKVIFKKSRKMAAEIAEELNLDEEESRYLQKTTRE